MDGNGRWAENKGLPRSEGHRAGVEVVKRIIRASMEQTIPVISLWAFGRDNWARPHSEVDYLMQLLFCKELRRKSCRPRGLFQITNDYLMQL